MHERQYCRDTKTLPRVRKCARVETHGPRSPQLVSDRPSRWMPQFATIPVEARNGHLVRCPRYERSINSKCTASGAINLPSQVDFRPNELDLIDSISSCSPDLIDGPQRPRRFFQLTSIQRDRSNHRHRHLFQALEVPLRMWRVTDDVTVDREILLSSAQARAFG